MPLFQSNGRLHDELRDIGCEFLCVAAIAETFTDHAYDADELNGVLEQLRYWGYWDRKLGLHQPRSYRYLFHRLFQIAHFPEYGGDMVGEIHNDTMWYYGWWEEGYHSQMLQRGRICDAIPHTVMLGNAFQISFNPSPSYSFFPSNHILLFATGLSDSLKYTGKS